MNSNNWFVCPQANSGAEIRLFLFPYAGAGPAAFHKWIPEFPDTVETWIAHYPGRGSRHHEPPIKKITTLVEEFSQAMQSILDKPFAFFGHSLGGLVAFELAWQLRQQNLSPLQTLFISACGAPHLPDPNAPIHGLPESEFIKSLQRLNGIPSELLHQPDVIQLLLPILRADFQAIESYVYLPNGSPLSCPIVAFGGVQDSRVSRERIEGWALHTNSGFRSQYFPGDHFFINTARDLVIASISAELSASHAKN